MVPAVRLETDQVVLFVASLSDSVTTLAKLETVDSCQSELVLGSRDLVLSN